jgi:hypothetical protein
VRLIPVEGYYDRGKTKQNKAEAEAIIREIIRRLSDPVLKNRSIGVVTFSAVQQNLIADMLETEFHKYPELDDLVNNAEEPIFIKNLENVQGDERDVILFSVGYGPDEQGRVALNFGPLNREGGWRRLNVAVSRARYEMLIFSVLKPEQIDLNRTRSDGITGLRAFLEFAERGVVALPDTNSKSVSSQGVVEIIAKEIQNLGYTVHTNVGCSGYQVDIGVIHPENPQIYMLGILLDSTNYYSGGTALDRNNTQEAVLRGLGWKLCRIWVLEWWDNPEKELINIKSNIDAAIKESVEDKKTLPEPEKIIVTQTISYEKMDNTVSNETLNFYFPAVITAIASNSGNADYFASYESTFIIKRQIAAVLEAEAPVSREVLCKRVLEAWGISRMGARISRRFDELFSALRVKSTSIENTVFYWRPGVEPLSYDDFRVPSSDEKSRRGLEQIPPEEIASAVKYILNQQIGLLMEDLDREISRIFGFARCTESMQKSIRAGVDIAIKKKWATIDGKRVNSG